ncbi:MAG: hypothetical protein ACI3W8_03090, partial [Oscillospiraceae bacterium]
MKREIRKCINYYLQNIGSDDFREYVEKEEQEGQKNHQKFIKAERPLWATRTDYFDDHSIAKVIITDTLSNDGVVRLLKKLYSLPKRKFRVKNYYKKPALKNKYDYIQLQYTHHGIGLFAEIEFIQDKYIDRIEISWTQVNNYFALVQYTFWFHKCLDDELYNTFISDNISKLTSKDYIVWYNLKNNNSDNYMALRQMHSEFFNTVCQHYITTFLYSEQGSIAPLLSITFLVRERPIDIDSLYISDCNAAFYNRKDNYVVLSDFDGDHYYLYSGNNRIPNFDPCRYIAKYGNYFYYGFLGEKELKLFERDFSSFSNGRQRIEYNKKVTQLSACRETRLHIRRQPGFQR